MEIFETSGRKKPGLVTKTVWVVAEAGLKSNPTQSNPTRVYAPDRSSTVLSK